MHMPPCYKGSKVNTHKMHLSDTSDLIEGLDHILDATCPTLSDSSTTGNDIPIDSVGQVIEQLSLSEAAIRLGVSERTIQRRISKGLLRSQKDEQGKVFVYCPTVSDTISVETRQDTTSADSVGQSNFVSDTMSDNDRLWQLVREQASKLEALTTRNGYLQAMLEERESEIKLLTDSQHKQPWWRRLTSWIKV
jgi:hypothetical protein